MTISPTDDRDDPQETDQSARLGPDPAREEANRIWRAMMLATDLETCEALLRGERVPRERVDPLWLARFGGRL